jgi:hypothetical protein
MVSAFIASYGLRGLKVGSPLLSIFEAAAESDIRNSSDLFSLLRATSLEHAAGQALDRLAADEGLQRQVNTFANAGVNVLDPSFPKVSSTVFAGTPAPIAGVSTLNLSSRTGFPSSGSVYVGRGTANLEGPLAYTGVSAHGAYWQLALSAPTQGFHNCGETVVLAQGGPRAIPAGSVCQTLAGNASSSVQFKTLYAATLPDGETEVDGVQVVALLPGIGGNVGAGAISSWVSLGGGLTCVNPLPVTSARAAESNDQLRERIRERRATRARGTVLALVTGVVGATSADENLTITSAAYVGPQSGSAATLFIDDGSGYEEIWLGVPTESVVALAAGGEQYFAIASDPPVTKANLTSSVSAPFDVPAGSVLAVAVGGRLYTHTFSASDFANPLAGTAYEVVASICADALLGFTAKTSGSGTAVTLWAKADANEDLQVQVPALVAGQADANSSLGFPVGLTQTMLLYRNDRLLSKDGQVAQLQSLPVSAWGSFAATEDLHLGVDGTTVQTYTITDASFAGTGFSTVGTNSLAAWAKVLNALLPGVTAAGAGNVLTLTSNAGATSRARLTLTGGSLLSKVFAAADVQGRDNDYSLNRNTGEFGLVTPLAPGDTLSLGSAWTRAFLESPDIAATTITDTAGGAPGANFWFVTDGRAEVIPSGLVPGSQVVSTVPRMGTWGAVQRWTAATGAPFTNVQPRDWLIAWDQALPALDQGRWRVSDVDPSGTWLEFGRQSLPQAGLGMTATLLQDGVTVLVCGGWRPDCNNFTASACLWNSATGTLTVAHPMTTARGLHTATLLDNGRVLVVGGLVPTPVGAESVAAVVPTVSCEIYIPGTNTWVPAASIPTAAAAHQACKLATGTAPGQVLVSGGWNLAMTAGVSTSYLYNPFGDSWGANVPMVHARVFHQMTYIPGGTDMVLVSGGTADTTDFIATCEAMQVTGLGAWSAVTGGNLNIGRWGHQVTVCGDGTIVATGGLSSNTANGYAATVVVETFAPGAFPAGAWSPTAHNTLNPHAFHAAVSLDTAALDLVLVGGVLVPVGTGFPAGPCWERSTDVAGSPWSSTYGQDFAGTSGLWQNGHHAAACNVPNTGTQVGAFIAGGATTGLYAAVGTAVAHSPMAAVTALATASLGYENAGAGTFNWLPVTATLVTTVAASDALATLTLAHGGAVFARTASGVQQVQVPAQVNVLAPALAAGLNAQLQGAQALVFQTDALRVSTSTYDLSGDIALVTADTQAQAFALPTGSASANLPSHRAAVASGASDLGTPSFQALTLTASASPSVIQVSTAGKGTQRGNAGISSGSALVGLADPWDNNVSFRATPPAPTANSGSALGWASTLSTQTPAQTNTSTVVTCRTPGPREWLPLDRFYDAAPYALTDVDALTVVLDGSAQNLGFTIPMGRLLSVPAGVTAYGQTNAFRDKNNAGLSLATAFGTVTLPGPTTGPGFDFSDFAVFMHARGISDAPDDHGDGDDFLAVLWRYTLLGEAGNFAGVRYDYPVKASAGISVVTDFYGQTLPTHTYMVTDFYGQAYGQNTNISVRLSSGAARSGTVIPAATRIGVAAPASLSPGANLYAAVFAFNLQVASATRVGHTTTLTLTPPTGVTNHGLAAGDAVYLTSLDNTDFPEGTYVISGTGALTISYADALGDYVVPYLNLGAITFGPKPASLDASNIVAGNVFTATPASGLPAAYCVTMSLAAGFDKTLGFQVGNVDTTPAVPAPAPSATLTWYQVGDPAGLSWYPLNAGGNTVTAIAAAVNALAAAPGSVCPVTAKVVAEDAPGTITQSSTDAQLVHGFYTRLTDGKNFVRSTGYSAPDYTLTFKDPIGAGLAGTFSDWAHEVVVVVPTSAANTSAWLNTLAVSGLSASASVQTGSAGHRVVIATDTIGSSGSVQVQGGSANSVSTPLVSAGTTVAAVSSSGYGTTLVASVTSAAATGLSGGQWCRLQNVNPQSRAAPIDAGTALTSIDSLGNVVVTGTPVAPPRATLSGRYWQVETQGNFVAFSCPAPQTLVPLSGFSAIAEGDYVFVSTFGLTTVDGLAPLSENNVGGPWRCVRVDAMSSTFWVENPSASAGTGWATVRVVANDSLLPGDVLTISSNTLWGANAGRWVVQSVGVPAGAGSPDLFQNQFCFQVKTSRTQPVAATGAVAALGANAVLIQVQEGQASSLVKKLLALAPNQGDATLTDLKFDSAAGADKVGPSAGTLVQPLDKLDFPTGVFVGVDAYSHSVGLIGEANRIIYGDAQDVATYPGIAAAGANINLAGPSILRVVLGIAVRLNVSTAEQDAVLARVASAVAAYVNSLGQGQAVVLGLCVAAAQAVFGVTSAAITFPAYGPGKDQLSVQPQQKPKVLTLSDISVSVIGQ